MEEWKTRRHARSEEVWGMIALRPSLSLYSGCYPPFSGSRYRAVITPILPLDYPTTSLTSADGPTLSARLARFGDPTTRRPDRYSCDSTTHRPNLPRCDLTTPRPIRRAVIR